MTGEAGRSAQGWHQRLSKPRLPLGRESCVHLLSHVESTGGTPPERPRRHWGLESAQGGALSEAARDGGTGVQAGCVRSGSARERARAVGAETKPRGWRAAKQTPGESSEEERSRRRRSHGAQDTRPRKAGAPAARVNGPDRRVHGGTGGLAAKGLEGCPAPSRSGGQSR